MKCDTIRRTSAQVLAYTEIVYGNPQLTSVLAELKAATDTERGLKATLKDLTSQGRFALHQKACVKAELARYDALLRDLHQRKFALLNPGHPDLDPDFDPSCPF